MLQSVFRWVGSTNIPPCFPGIVLASVLLVTSEAVPVLESPATESAGHGLIGSVLAVDVFPHFAFGLVDIVAKRAAPANFQFDHLGVGPDPVVLGFPKSTGPPASNIP